jgi:hypothetical protein
VDYRNIRALPPSRSGNPRLLFPTLAGQYLQDDGMEGQMEDAGGPADHGPGYEGKGKEKAVDPPVTEHGSHRFLHSSPRRCLFLPADYPPLCCLVLWTIATLTSSPRRGPEPLDSSSLRSYILADRGGAYVVPCSLPLVGVRCVGACELGNRAFPLNCQRELLGDFLVLDYCFLPIKLDSPCAGTSRVGSYLIMAFSKTST